MADKKWNELGEEIRDAVNGAVLSGDFSGLSRSLGDLVENAVKTADEKARQANDPRQMSRGQTASGGGTQPAWYAKKPQGLGGSIAMMVIGYVLLIIGLILVMCSAILLTVSRVFVIFLLLFLVMVAGGLWLGFSGTSKMILISRFRQYHFGLAALCAGSVPCRQVRTGRKDGDKRSAKNDERAYVF